VEWTGVGVIGSGRCACGVGRAVAVARAASGRVRTDHLGKRANVNNRGAPRLPLSLLASAVLHCTLNKFASSCVFYLRIDFGDFLRQKKTELLF
jgi:hypothetical protein